MVAAPQLHSRQLYAWLIATAIVTLCALVYAAETTHGLLAMVAVGMFATVV